MENRKHFHNMIGITDREVEDFVSDTNTKVSLLVGAARGTLKTRQKTIHQ